MNKTIFLLSVLLSSFVVAQERTPNQDSQKNTDRQGSTKQESERKNYNEIIKKEDQLKNPPLEYKELRERDVLWSTVVWEQIDLNQKFNLPLYFPIDTLNPNRLSLFEVILRGIKKGGNARRFLRMIIS